jgi:predicted exporter
MTRGERQRLLALLGLVLALAVFVTTRFSLTTDVTAFLPDPDDRELAALSREIMNSDLSRTMVLTIGAEQARTAAHASREFEARLRADPRVATTLAFLEGGPRAETERAAYALFAPRRLAYLAPTAEAARTRLQNRGLRDAAADLRERLAGPLSPVIARLAPEDPLLVLPALLERVQSSRGGTLSIVEGRFIAPDGQTAVLFLATRHSAFDESHQAPLLEAIDQQFAALAAEQSTPLTLGRSGVNRYAVRAAAAIRADIQRVSIASSIALCAGLLLLFRSLRMVALAAIPVLSGLIAGCAAGLFFFDRLHGVTLAFGAALISVSVDYVVHLYCHDALVAPEEGARGSLRALRLPLATACLTTIAGFAALAGSSLGGLREIGTFSIAGIAMAYLATHVFVPAGLGNRAHRRLDRNGWHRVIEAGLRRLRGQRRALALLPAGLLIFIALGLYPLRWESDVASMSRLDAEIRAEDEAVREKVTRMEQMRFVVALGSDEEQALATNEAVAATLASAVASGELGGFSNLMPLLPSKATQRAVAEVATADPTLAGRWIASFEAAGFQADRFRPFLDSLDAAPPTPLSLDDLLDSPLAGLARPFVTPLLDRVAIVSFLESVQDAAALETRLRSLSGVRLIEQSRLMHDAQVAYQRSTRNALGFGLAAVLILLGLRYRDARRTLAAFAPPALAVATTVAALGISGRGVDLVSLTSLLFVACLGVDYSVLLVDAMREPSGRGLSAAVLGASIACGTTVFAFGLLSLSAHPVLANLGFTTTVGVATSFVLAPVTIALSGLEPAAGRSS